jgi:hypothetical protein
MVVPLYVFAPLKTKVPDPAFVRTCAPLTTPPRVSWPASSMKLRGAPRVIGAVKVLVPLWLSIPTPPDPVRVTAFPDMEYPPAI